MDETKKLDAIDVDASRDAAHPAHNFHLGQIFGTVLLGLSAYRAQDAAGGPAALLTPGALSDLFTGFSSIWLQKQ